MKDTTRKHKTAIIGDVKMWTSYKKYAFIIFFADKARNLRLKSYFKHKIE